MDDRRKHPREFPRRTTATVRTAIESRDLRLLDESDGGIGLFGGDVGALASGQVAEITLSNGQTRSGTITHIASHPQGGFRVGIEWK